MKIILFDINRLSFEGGAEKYFTEVGEELAQKGHEVIFLGDCRPVLKFYIWLSVFQFLNPIWKLPELFTRLKISQPLNQSSKNKITHFPLRLRILFSYSKERKRIKEILDEADLVLVKNEFSELIFLWLLKTLTNNKYLMVFSSLKYPNPKSVREKLHNLLYLSKFYKFLVKKFHKIIVSNKEDQNYFIKTLLVNSKKVLNIAYGLRDKYFVQKNELKNLAGFNILFVGRMEEQKGIIYLKQIIENINKDSKKKTISFTLVGSGPLENIPKQLGERYKNVDYKGQLSPTEVRKYYLQSDLVIITSKWETFSYVCLEAQACGCPVVAFDIPGPQDIISQNTGSLVSLGNIFEMQEKIYFYLTKKVKNNPEEYLKKRILISEIMAEKYSLEKTVEKLKNLT